MTVKEFYTIHFYRKIKIRNIQIIEIPSFGDISGILKAFAHQIQTAFVCYSFVGINSLSRNKTSLYAV